MKLSYETLKYKCKENKRDIIKLSGCYLLASNLVFLALFLFLLLNFDFFYLPVFYTNY